MLRLALQIIRAGEVPPPSTVGASCVYILRRVDGRFYCGETDSLKSRLATHRKKRGWSRTEAAYMVLPFGAQGKSTAVALEAQTIQVGFLLGSYLKKRFSNVKQCNSSLLK